MIKDLSQFLPIKTLIVMYKSLVRPHLDYCDIIFHNPPQEDVQDPTQPFADGPLRSALMTKVESVQYQADLTRDMEGKQQNQTFQLPRSKRNLRGQVKSFQKGFISLKHCKGICVVNSALRINYDVANYYKYRVDRP